MGAGSGTVWTVSVPNSLFGVFNPFAEEIDGDWIVYPEQAPPTQAPGRRLPERAQLLRGGHPGRGDRPAAAHRGARRLDRERPTASATRSRPGYVWYAEVGADATTIWANFQGADPNAELVEINVRRSVFYPTEHHVDYITVRGFELAQAACPWTPPTADQPGLIGPNWAKGWIIEDNVIHDAKCSAVSLGKEASTGHNYATLRGDKPGYQYQLESVFSARQIGWDREHIGSHVVRRNTIFDCGQNGIVGHLGCVFSTIEDNHIYNIALKREFYGYEIAGIKLHAAIDVVIRHNRIHDCSLGTWLDWQTQGTRISRNLYYRNNRDLFVEVSHGPYLVDHNVLASPASLELFSQGGAFVHNLVCGTVALVPVVERPTPYHRPHSTQVAGYAAIYGGDDRCIGNVFLGGDPARRTDRRRKRADAAGYGTAGYNGHPTSLDGLHRPRRRPSRGDHERFLGREAAGLHSRQRLRRRRQRLRGASRAPVVSRRCRRAFGRRRGRRGLPGGAAAGGFDGARVGAVTGRISSASGLSTRTSKSATAPRRFWTPTLSARPGPTGRLVRPGRSPRSERACPAPAFGDAGRDLVGVPCFRLRGHYFVIATLVVAESVFQVFTVWDWVGGAIGLEFLCGARAGSTSSSIATRRRTITSRSACLPW